jgi:hypothetical protein
MEKQWIAEPRFRTPCLSVLSAKNNPKTIDTIPASMKATFMTRRSIRDPAVSDPDPTPSDTVPPVPPVRPEYLQ